MENKWSTKPGQEWIKCPHCEITFRVRKPSQEGQAGVSALEELVKVWREAADAYHTQAEANRSHGKDALQNQIYCGAYQNCADSLERALATAPPEQAAKVLDFEKPGQISVNAPTCDKCGKIFLDCKCSQAASAGALSADSFAQIIKDLREAKATINGKPVMEVSAANNWIADRIEAALAAHDQKVQAEVLEEAANEAKKYGLGHEGDSIAAAIRRLKFPAASAASKPEAAHE